jgi:hypothetical protein
MKKMGNTGDPDHITWLKRECNFYTNGTCATMACLIRGGYDRSKRKTIRATDFKKATCLAKEAICERETFKEEITHLEQEIYDLEQFSSEYDSYHES